MSYTLAEGLTIYSLSGTHNLIVEQAPRRVSVFFERNPEVYEAFTFRPRDTLERPETMLFDVPLPWIYQKVYCNTYSGHTTYWTNSLLGRTTQVQNLNTDKGFCVPLPGSVNGYAHCVANPARSKYIEDALNSFWMTTNTAIHPQNIYNSELCTYLTNFKRPNRCDPHNWGEFLRIQEEVSQYFQAWEALSLEELLEVPFKAEWPIANTLVYGY